MKKLDEYLKVAEASVFLGISQNTLRKWTDEGRIPVHVIAEALNPFNGSWKGHDLPNRSEHYFHSGYVDLIITGLVGLRPDDGDTFVVDPLARLTYCTGTNL